MATITASQPKKTKRADRSSNKTNLAYLYLLPAFIVMAAITFYPLIYQVWVSTTDFGLQNLRVDSPPPNNVGIKNYLDILSDNMPLSDVKFWAMLTFDFWWAFSNVVFHVVAGVLIAVLLNVEGLWFKKIYRAIYILPMVIPALVTATVWKNFFDSQYGVINQLMAAVGSVFGLPAETFEIDWLGSIDAPIQFLFPAVSIGTTEILRPLPLSYYALMITNFWLGWPFMCIVATGALQSIPKDLYEAASIDGAPARTQLMKITVPLLRPAMIPAALIGFATTFNLFSLIYFMSAGGPLRQTEILVTVAFRLVNEARAYGIAAAFAVIVFAISATIFLVTNRITKATESYDV